MSFNRNNPRNRFDFLGFEFYWGQDRNGQPYLMRRTSRKKLRESISKLNKWLRANRSLKIRYLFRKLNRMLRGYFNYYGMRGNYSSLREYFWYVKFYVRKWLSRRSQRGHVTWERMYGIINRFNMERPHINEKDGPRVLRKVVFY